MKGSERRGEEERRGKRKEREIRRGMDRERSKESIVFDDKF